MELMQKDKYRGLASLLTVVLVLVMFLSPCAPVGPDFVKPETDTPAHWSDKQARVGSIGFVSAGAGNSNFGNLFDSDSLTYSFGSSFSWPFLNYGCLKNNVRVQNARLQRAFVNYHEAVLQAARENENAMAVIIGARQKVIILEQAAVAAKRSKELSTLR